MSHCPVATGPAATGNGYCPAPGYRELPLHPPIVLLLQQCKQGRIGGIWYHELLTLTVYGDYGKLTLGTLSEINLLTSIFGTDKMSSDRDCLGEV